MDELIGAQEYLVTDGFKVQEFVFKNLDLDAEADTDYCTVYELTEFDHQLIRAYIDKNQLWSE